MRQRLSDLMAYFCVFGNFPLCCAMSYLFSGVRLKKKTKIVLGKMIERKPIAQKTYGNARVSADQGNQGKV